MENYNLDLSDSQLAKIRKLDDFDLKMLLSEINDYGWNAAKIILDSMHVK